MKKISIKSTFVAIMMVAFLLSVVGLTRAEIVEPRFCEGTEKVLYLEFNGAVVQSRVGDFWLGSPSVTIPAYDLSFIGWGGLEKLSIQYIMESLAEEYKPYSIHITTEKPISGEYNIIYIGGNNSWFRPDSSVIGVATYDPENRDDSNYGFVFSKELEGYYLYGSGDLKEFSMYMANLIAHEAGHNFGLNHVDNTKAIMNPYLPLNPVRTVFSSSNIPGTDHIHDSYQMLEENLGVSIRDVIGNDCANAYNLFSPVDGVTVSKGFIYNWEDVDVFSFKGENIPTRIYIPYDSIGGFFHNLYPKVSVRKQSDGSNIVSESFVEGKGIFITFTPETDEQYCVFVESMWNTIVEDSTYGGYTLNYATSPPVCGNGVCENPMENKMSCALDCIVCGDDACDNPPENKMNCALDCAECGDYICDNPPENILNCQIDCEEVRTEPHSKIVNNMNRPVTGTLTMKLQRKFGETWAEQIPYTQVIVNNQEIIIPAEGLIKLDIGQDNLGNQIFAGWNNLDAYPGFVGDHRVYVEFEAEGQFFNNSWEFRVS